jgi:HNH endonuclease
MNEVLPPPLSRMTRQHKYNPVGRCIYCSGDGKLQQLTLEHIIPESLGGMLELPEASCQACQAITSAFEGDNAGNLFRPIRRQFKMPSKSRGNKRRQERAQETFLIVIDGVKRRVPVNEYPGFLMSFVFPLPTALLGISPKDEGFSGGITLGTLPQFGERLNVLRAKYGAKVTFPTKGSAESVGRLLAKIAHAYSCAEVGLDGFKPYLLDVIGDQAAHLLGHFVGSAASTTVGEDLHEIEILPPERFGTGNLIVVRIHLFSNYQGMPIHYVVAGERR